MSNCPKCGSPIIFGERFCPECGEPVQNINHSDIFNDSISTTSSSDIGDPIAINPLMPEIPDIAEVPEMPTIADLPGTPVGNMLGNQDIPSFANFPEPSIEDILANDNPPTIAEMPMNLEEPVLSDLPIDSLVSPTLDMAPDISILPKEDSIQESEKLSSKKSSDKFPKIMLVAIVILAALAILLMGFFMMRMFSNKNQPTGDNILVAKEYHYEGFQLYIPDEIDAEVYNGNLYVGRKNSSWSAVMTLQNGVYNTLVSNKSQLIDYFESMGYEITLEPTEREVSGTAFVKMEVLIGTKNVLVAYAKANGTKVFGIVLKKESGEYTDDDLKPIGTILSTMNFTGPNYQLPDGFQLDSFIGTFTLAE